MKGRGATMRAGMTAGTAASAAMAARAAVSAATTATTETAVTAAGTTVEAATGADPMAVMIATTAAATEAAAAAAAETEEAAAAAVDGAGKPGGVLAPTRDGTKYPSPPKKICLY